MNAASRTQRKGEFNQPVAANGTDKYPVDKWKIAWQALGEVLPLKLIVEPDLYDKRFQTVEEYSPLK